MAGSSGSCARVLLVVSVLLLVNSLHAWVGIVGAAAVVGLLAHSIFTNPFVPLQKQLVSLAPACLSTLVLVFASGEYLQAKGLNMVTSSAIALASFLLVRSIEERTSYKNSLHPYLASVDRLRLVLDFYREGGEPVENQGGPGSAERGASRLLYELATFLRAGEVGLDWGNNSRSMKHNLWLACFLFDWSMLLAFRLEPFICFEYQGFAARLMKTIHSHDDFHEYLNTVSERASEFQNNIYKPLVTSIRHGLSEDQKEVLKSVADRCDALLKRFEFSKRDPVVSLLDLELRHQNQQRLGTGA